MRNFHWKVRLWSRFMGCARLRLNSIWFALYVRITIIFHVQKYILYVIKKFSYISKIISKPLYRHMKFSKTTETIFTIIQANNPNPIVSPYSMVFSQAPRYAQNQQNDTIYMYLYNILYNRCPIKHVVRLSVTHNRPLLSAKSFVGKSTCRLVDIELKWWNSIIDYNRYKVFRFFLYDSYGLIDYI